MEAGPSLLRRLMSLRPRSVVARDGILAGLLILLYGFFQLMRAIEPPFEGPPSTGEMAIALSMVVVSFAPVALRRRAPRTALAWCGIAWIVSQLLASDVGTVVSMAVIAYSTAAYRTPKDALAALSVVSGLWVLALTVAMGLGEIRLLVGAAVGTVGVPGLVGTVVQSRRDRTDQLKERAATLEREREQRDLNAARDERLRIAREMHDVVAHHLTGIVVTPVLPSGERKVILPERARRSGRFAIRAAPPCPRGATSWGPSAKPATTATTPPTLSPPCASSTPWSARPASQD